MKYIFAGRPTAVYGSFLLGFMYFEAMVNVEARPRFHLFRNRCLCVKTVSTSLLLLAIDNKPKYNTHF